MKNFKNQVAAITGAASGMGRTLAVELAKRGCHVALSDVNELELAKTAELGRAVYFSRSRGKLWFKGEESGHVQTVHEIRTDCDTDVVLLKVTQLGHEPGIACHTGRHSCFFNVLQGDAWQAADPVLKDPESIYK